LQKKKADKAKKAEERARRAEEKAKTSKRRGVRRRISEVEPQVTPESSPCMAEPFLIQTETPSVAAMDSSPTDEFGDEINVCCMSTTMMLLKVVELTGYFVNVDNGSMKTVLKRW